MNSSYNNLTVWLGYVSYPVTAAAYFERALRRMLHCVTLGPILPTHLITDWKLEQMKLPILPHDISTSFTPDMGKIMATVGEENRPDLFLFIESVGGFSPKNMPALKCPTACYLIDNHVSLTAQLEWAKQFDYVFIAQRAYLDEFKKINTHSYWLPLGCDPEIHFKYPAEKLYDICFAGGFINGARRHNLLKLLEENFNFGYDRIFWDEMALFFSQSKIVFNNAYKDDLNMRYFEALSIGSLMLADMAHGSGLEELFIPTEEYALYTDDTLVDVVRYYLKHDDLRKQIAGNGRKTVHTAHTYAHRVFDLLSVIFSDKKNTYTPLELRSLSQNRELSENNTNMLKHSAQASTLSVYSPYRLPARIRRVIYYPHETYPVFQLFNEWAFEFANTLSADCQSADARLHTANPVTFDNEYDFVFVSVLSQLEPYRANHKLVAMVNDVWPYEYETFIELTKLLPLVYVTNMKVCFELQQRGQQNVRFMPFSIASQYVSDKIPEKNFDIIQYGRCNPVLSDYMSELLSRYPSLHYLTTEVDLQKKGVYFVSNKHGVMGRSDQRHTFMRILSQCKISLVSSPGYDIEHDLVRDTGGCYTAAIRYFESASQYCHMLSRHPCNDDFVCTGLDEICDQVSSYQDFEERVTQYLSEPFSIAKQRAYRSFLNKNITTCRAEQVRYDIYHRDGIRTAPPNSFTESIP